MAPKTSPAYSADIYNKARPTYPEKLFEIIKDFAKSKGTPFKNALDVGCGTGLATRELVNFLNIDKVIGLDPSENMILQAKEASSGASDRIEYVKGNAEDISTAFAPESFDLITAAECAHWIDMEAFYASAFECLEPGGVLAIFSYCHLLFPSHPSVYDEMIKFTQVTLKPYWDERRPRLDRLYADPDYLMTPFPKMERRLYDGVENPLIMNFKWSLAQVKEYINTWSAYKSYLVATASLGEKTDILDELIDFIRKETKVTSDDQVLDVAFQMVVILCLK